MILFLYSVWFEQQENKQYLCARRYAHHAHSAPAQHELYVFRDALVPKAYAPSSLRKAPAPVDV